MRGFLESGWVIAMYTAIAVALLLLGTFHLEKVLANRKRKMGPQLVKSRRTQASAGRRMDAQGRGTSRGRVSMGRSTRQGPRLVP